MRRTSGAATPDRSATFDVTATEPSDGELAAGQISFWLNQTANLLVVKVKYADGTVKSGTMALI